jgi:hypothetical protein
MDANRTVLKYWASGKGYLEGQWSTRDGYWTWKSLLSTVDNTNADDVYDPFSETENMTNPGKKKKTNINDKDDNNGLSFHFGF